MASAAPTETSKSTQMNVRIDRALKQRGDEVFARLGCTPTQAVRALYRFAVENSPDDVRHVLETSSETEDSQREAKHKALHVLWEKLDVQLHEFLPAEQEGSPDLQKPIKELLGDAVLERYESKGAL